MLLINRIADVVRYVYRRPQHILIKLLALKSAELDVSTMHKVLIVSPHPDDEVFGCGMLMNKLVCSGKDVKLIILSKGEFISEGSGVSEDVVVKARAELTLRAAAILGLDGKDIHTLSFPDGKFADVPKEEIGGLENLIKEISPDCLFYPHPFEGSPDHMVATQILERLTDGMNIPRYYYCVWLWHHMPLIKIFKLNFDRACVLTGDAHKKQQAVDNYALAQHESGLYYSGKLPKMLLKAISWKKELFFKA